MQLSNPRFKKGDIVFYPTLLGEVRKGRVNKVIKYYDNETKRFDHYGYLVIPVNNTYFQSIIMSDYIYTDRSNAYRGYRRWKVRSNLG